MRLGLGLGLGKSRGGQAGGATGILDSYTGATFAFAPDTLIYSNHSVEDTAVGSETEVDSPNPGDNPAAPYTVRVRRSTTPSAVRSFTHTEVSDGTLVTWVGVGNDGFVEAAYDQSGNDNHATQSTAGNQPKIVDAGSLVVENGKAALDFDGVNDWMKAESIGSHNSHLLTILSRWDSGYLHSIGYTLPESTILFRSSLSFNLFQNIAEDQLNVSITPSRNIISVDRSNLDINLALDGTIEASLVSSSILNGPGLNHEIGWAEERNNAAQYLNGAIQVVLYFDSDQSANRTAIETAINNEYSIY